MSTKRNGESALSQKDKIKSAIYHAAEGADDFVETMFNTSFGNFGRTNAMVLASAVTGLGAASVFGLATFPAVFAAAVAPIGVSIGGGTAGLAGVAASKRTKFYKDKLPSEIASHWNKIGKGLGAAFALAGGIAVGMGIYNSMNDCQPETNSKQTSTMSYSLGTGYTLQNDFVAARNNEANDNKPPIELSAVHHGNTIKLQI